MDRRTFLGGACCVSLAGCLRLQGGSGESTATSSPTATATAEADGVNPVDETTTTESRVSVDDLGLDRVRDLPATLYGGVFTRQGSFVGVTDDGIGQVSPDGTVEWESDRIADELFPQLPEAIDFADGTVFVGCSNDSRDATRVYAFDDASGQRLWSHDTDPDNWFVSSVAADDRAVFYASNQLGSDANPIVTARDHDGESLWSRPFPSETPVETLLLHDDRLYLSSDRLYAMDRNDPESLTQVEAPSGGGLTRSGDAAFDRSVNRIDLADGTVEWTTRISSDYGPGIRPSVRDGVVVTGTDAGYVLAIDADAGDIRWEARVDGPVTEIALTDDYAFVVDRNGEFYILDLTEGVLRHQRTVRDEEGVATHVAVSGTELIFDADRTVYELVE